MSGASIQIEDRNSIFQVFCGRWEEANVLDHQGFVLRRMHDFSWKELKRYLGLTHVYLLGLWDTAGPILVNEEQGEDISTKKNRCPSPFAITDHIHVSPLLGTKDDLISLINCIHDHGLSVIVDFVPNHTGSGHPWLSLHPEYYKKNSSGNPSSAFSGDVFELDYANSEVCDEMLRILDTLFTEYPIDGVRCDMAHLIPTSFWRTAINTLRHDNPHRIFIAEAYSDSVFDLTPQYELMNAGFNAVYDEPLFRNARSLIQSIKPMFGHIGYELSQQCQNWIHYVSNHDDSAWCDGDALWHYQQLFLLMRGWNLLYNGTLWGFEGRLAHHWVQLLPRTYYDPTLLADDRKQWLEWYTNEKPIMTAFDSLTDTSVTIAWKGQTSQGVLEYTF